MKKITLPIFFLLWKIALFSQTYLPITPTDYGTQANRYKAKFVLHLPVYNNDTTLNTTDTSAQIRINNGQLQYHYGVWRTPSGSSTNPTWQETLDAGSTLNKMNTINGGSNKLIFDNVQELRYTYNSGYATNYSFFSQEGFKTTVSNTDGVDAGIEMLGNNAHLSAGKLSNNFSSDLIVDADSGFLAKIKTPDIDTYTSFNLSGDLNANLHLHSGKVFSIKNVDYPTITTRLTGNSFGVSDLTGGNYNGSMYYNAATKQFFVTFRDSTRKKWFDISLDTAHGFQVGEADSVLLFRVDTARNIWMPYLPDKDVSITKMLYISNSGRLAVGDAPAGGGGVTLAADSGFIPYAKYGGAGMALTTRLKYDTVKNLIHMGQTTSGTPRIGFPSSNTNVAFGDSALASTAGSYNIGIGAKSLKLNTTGTQNIGIDFALVANTTGTDNIAIGVNTLSKNATGGSNIAIGTNAMREGLNQTGGIGIGVQALRYNTSGYDNTAVGFSAMMNSTTATNGVVYGKNAALAYLTGNGITAIGRSAFYNVTSGNWNTALGDSAGVNLTSGTRNVAIGYNTLFPSATGSDQLNIVNILYSADGTKLGAFTNAPTNKVDINGDLRIRTIANGTVGTDSLLSVTGGVVTKMQSSALLSTVVPYTGAASDVNLGNKNLTVVNGGKIIVDNQTTSAATNVTITASRDDNWVEGVKIDNRDGIFLQYGNADAGSGMTAYQSTMQSGGNHGILTLFSNNVTSGAYTGTSQIQFRVGDNTAVSNTLTMNQDGRIYAQRIATGASVDLLYYNTSTKEITHAPATVGLQRTMTATKMSTGERVAMRDKEEGTMVYDTTIHKLYVWDGNEWQAAW